MHLDLHVPSRVDLLDKAARHCEQIGIHVHEKEYIHVHEEYCIITMNWNDTRMKQIFQSHPWSNWCYSVPFWYSHSRSFLIIQYFPGSFQNNSKSLQYMIHLFNITLYFVTMPNNSRQNDIDIHSTFALPNP